MSLCTPEKLPGVPLETFAKALPAFLVRVSKKLLTSLHLDALPAHFPDLEAKLRQSFGLGSLPQPVTAQAVSSGAASSAGGASCQTKGKSIEPDAMPALRFGSDEHRWAPSISSAGRPALFPVRR